MTYTFLSFSGTQVMAVLDPLEACLKENLPIGAIHVCATAQTRQYAEAISRECAKKGLFGYRNG